MILYEQCSSVGDLMKRIENLKDNIINEAVKIIKEDPSKLSIRKLASSCNVGVGTMYNYYRNKDEVVIDCMRYYWEQFMAEVKSTTWLNDSKKDLRTIHHLLEVHGNSFRVDLLSSTEPEIIHKARSFHQNSFKYFIQLIDDVLNINDLEVSEFIALNLYATLRTPGYEYKKLERIVFSKLIN